MWGVYICDGVSCSSAFEVCPFPGSTTYLWVSRGFSIILDGAEKGQSRQTPRQTEIHIYFKGVAFRRVS